VTWLQSMGRNIPVGHQVNNTVSLTYSTSESREEAEFLNDDIHFICHNINDNIMMFRRHEVQYIHQLYKQGRRNSEEL